MHYIVFCLEQNAFNLPAIPNFKNINGNINIKYVDLLEKIFWKANAIVKKKQEQEGIGKHFICQFNSMWIKNSSICLWL